MSMRLEGVPQPDGRLGRYRSGAATVFDGNVLVGHLVTRVQVWWIVVGHLWWRRGVDPVEKMEWLLSWVPGQSGGFGETGYVDGVDDVEPMIEELGVDRFDLQGVSYRVEWLQGAEAGAVWAEYGWD